MASCGSGNKEKASELPTPGTIVDSMSVPITTDSLNKGVFSIIVSADSAVNEGVYDIEANYGPNNAKGKLTMPKGMEHVVPSVVHTDSNTYVIGFHVPEDTTFYSYLEVTSTHDKTDMRYIRSYSFQ